MLSPDKQKQLKAAMMTIWIIWGAMIASLLIYLVVALLFDEKMVEQNRLDPEILKIITNSMLAVSAVLLLAAFFLRRSLFNKPPEIVTTPIQEPPLPTGQYLTNMIICLALCEVVGIFGFIIYMLGGGFTSLIFFIAIGIAGMIIFKPSQKHIEKLTAINSDRQVTNQPLM